jgi:hypothetical protein
MYKEEIAQSDFGLIILALIVFMIFFAMFIFWEILKAIFWGIKAWQNQ